MVGVKLYDWYVLWSMNGRVRGTARDVLYGVYKAMTPEGTVKVDAIAAAALRSRSTIERGLRELQAVGALTREKKPGSRYVVLNLRHP